MEYNTSKILKLSFYFTSNCVLKCANVLTRFAFEVRQKFEAVPCEQKSFPDPSGTQ